MSRSLPDSVAVMLVLSFLTVLPAVAQSSAGVLRGTVVSVEPNGKFLQVKVVETEPADLASVDEEAKVMVNWTRMDGELVPKPEEAALVKGQNVGGAFEHAVRRDAKYEGFRLASVEAVAAMLEQARRVAETMVIPEKPTPVTPNRIAGADLARLAALETGDMATVEIASGDDVAKALGKARDLLNEGKAVRVRFGPGTYDLATGPRTAMGGGEAREPLLIIEGAGPEATILDFKDKRAKNRELLTLNNKHNCVIRGLAFVNHKGSPVRVGIYQPVQGNADILIEYCRFEGCETGLTVFHCNGITIRNVDASRNRRTGLFLIARNAVVEDSTFCVNAGAGPGSFRGGIALAALDTRISRVHCDDNPGGAAGLRMDHSCENVIVEESTFNNNGGSGTVWETALGPCELRNCRMNDNGKAGIVMATAYNFSLIDCELRNNGKAQALLLAKPRPVIFEKRGTKTAAYGAADLSVDVGENWTNLKGMMGNRFLTVRKCTFATRKPDAPFYAHEYGKPDIYKTLFKEQFIGEGNTYICPGTAVAFDTFQGEYDKLNLVSLDEWRTWTGQEAASRWVNATDGD